MADFCTLIFVVLDNVSLTFRFTANPFQPSVAFHIETSHFFCRAKQMTSFYVKRNTGLKWGNHLLSYEYVSKDYFYAVASFYSQHLLNKI